MSKLIFNTIKPDVQFYLRFDSDSGACVGVSTLKKGNCIEIDSDLANDLNKGKEMMSSYTVVFENNRYVLKRKEQVQQYTNQNYCKNLFRVTPNKNDECIRFSLDMSKKEWTISMDQSLRKHLKKTMTFENWLYDFYVVDQNDFNNLYYSFKMDLLKLISDNFVKIKHTVDDIPALMCRKIFNYSIEIKNAY